MPVNPYAARLLQQTGSRAVRSRIRPRGRDQDADYKSYVETLLGRPDVDLSKPEAFEQIRTAARRFAGYDMDDEQPLTDPYAQRQQRVAGEFERAGRGGRAVMARMRAARLEEAAPRRQAVTEYRERMRVGQEARDVEFRKAREEAGGSIGIIRHKGVAIPEALFEKRMRERRDPLARPDAPEIARREAAVDKLNKTISQLEGGAGYITQEGRAARVADLKKKRANLEQSMAELGERAGETATIQAFEFDTQTRPVMEQQRAAEERANELGDAAMKEDDPDKRAELWAQFKETQSKANELGRQAAAGPQAPSATALGEEQYGIQSRLERERPEREALEQRMVGRSREAIATVVREQRRRQAAREAAIMQPGTALPLKATSQTARDKYYEAQTEQLRNAMPKHIGDAWSSHFETFEKPVVEEAGDVVFAEGAVATQEQHDRAMRSLEAIGKRMEEMGKWEPGTTARLLGEEAEGATRSYKPASDDEVDDALRQAGGDENKAEEILKQQGLTGQVA